MTITTTTLTKAAGLAATVAGVLFVGVQVGHPHLDAAFTATGEYAVREAAKVVMAVLSLVGITGMYLCQVQRSGVLGLIGYLVFGAGYLILASIQLIALCVLPFLAGTSPGYVDNVLIVAVGGTPPGDIGPLQTLIQISGITFLAGGFLFGIALFRAAVLARWAAALLAVASVATVATSLLPQINPRFLAVPVGVAMVGLGYSLWRRQVAPIDVFPAPAKPAAADATVTNSAPSQ